MLVGNSNNEGGIANINNGTFFTQFFGQGATGSILNVAMTCGSRDTARARKAAGVKVWRYRYFGDWPNQYIADGAGAYHGSEVPMVFGSTEHYRDVSDTVEEGKVVAEMMHAWATFAKDPDQGLTTLGWPEYDESSKKILSLKCLVLSD
jgi:carboxylesterase type B